MALSRAGKNKLMYKSEGPGKPTIVSGSSVKAHPNVDITAGSTNVSNAPDPAGLPPRSNMVFNKGGMKAAKSKNY